MPTDTVNEVHSEPEKNNHMHNLYEDYDKMNRNLIINLREVKEYKVKIHKAANNFFVNHDVQAFIDDLKIIGTEQHAEQISKILMSKGFDYKQIDRDRIIDLIVVMVNESIISKDNLVQSCNILLCQVPDLILDVPHVAFYFENYIVKLHEKKVLTYGKSRIYLDALSTYTNNKIELPIKNIIKNIFEEYFLSESIDACIEEIIALDDPEIHFYVIKNAISLSFDKKNPQRELISQLLAQAEPDEEEAISFQRKSVKKAFLFLLTSIDNLKQDVPYVNEYLSFFIARAIYDECIAPVFLDQALESLGNTALPVIQAVMYIQKSNHLGEYLSHIWGPGMSSISEIKLNVKEMAKEYFHSGGKDKEFLESIAELDSPNYHYEIIKQLFSTMLDHESKYVPKVINLIKNMIERGVMSKEQVEKGFTKIDELLPEYEIDVPNAKKVFLTMKDGI